MQDGSRGFTIVELLVSVTLFSVAMIISISTLLIIIDANAKAQAVNTAMTNVSFAMDNMSRNLQTGYRFYCGSGNPITNLDPGTQDCVGGEQNGGIVFNREVDGTRMGYRKNGTKIEQRIGSDPWLPITSSDVTIDRFVVFLEGSQQADTVQPVTSILISGSVTNGLDTLTEFELQSRATQRVIDL